MTDCDIETMNDDTRPVCKIADKSQFQLIIIRSHGNVTGLINFPWYSRVNALENSRFAMSGWGLWTGAKSTSQKRNQGRSPADRPSKSRVIRIVNILTWNNNLDEARFIFKNKSHLIPRSSISKHDVFLRNEFTAS